MNEDNAPYVERQGLYLVSFRKGHMEKNPLLKKKKWHFLIVLTLA